MMTTLRVVATCSSSSRARWDAAGGLWDAKDRPELREIADLEVGRLHVGGEGGGLPVDPRAGHAHPAGAQYVGVGAVAHEQRVGRFERHLPQRGLEDDRLRLAPAHLVGDDDGLEEMRDTLTLEDGPAGRRVVE